MNNCKHESIEELYRGDMTPVMRCIDCGIVYRADGAKVFSYSREMGDVEE